MNWFKKTAQAQPMPNWQPIQDPQIIEQALKSGLGQMLAGTIKPEDIQGLEPVVQPILARQSTELMNAINEYLQTQNRAHQQTPPGGGMAYPVASRPYNRLKMAQSQEITLKTEARDNRGKAYPVNLKNENGKWILSIEGTPGRWYLKTLLKEAPEALSIYGFDWGCINVRELLEEAQAATQDGFPPGRNTQEPDYEENAQGRIPALGRSNDAQATMK